MKKIEILVEDEFYDELLQMLRKDKITLIDEFYFQKKFELKSELDDYLAQSKPYRLYTESIDESNSWLES